MIDALLTDWPGKSASNGIAHPAAYHMLDVAAVAEELISPFGLQEDLRDALILLTALHDLGKISASFRDMLLFGKTQPIGRHWEMTEYLLSHYDAEIEVQLGGRKSARRKLYASVAGHHGKPPNLDLRNPRFPKVIGEEAIEAAGLVIKGFMQLWPNASLNQLTKDQTRWFSWWLPGLIAAADWIGSNQTWFPAVAPGPGLADYLDQARGKKLTAVNSAAISVTKPAETALFDFDLRAMQRACEEIELPAGPMLAVIEDETGSGKTEASLILAQRMMLAGKGKGLFFALPTTATSDAMFSRARKIIPKMFLTRPSLALAHGRAKISNEYKELITNSALNTDEPVCTEWLADNRRKALLANVGVGTIDQALLSILPTRFNTLRHFGLSSKILIVDEVHEMGEPYMAQELARLLEAHYMAGGSAILLTATLPIEQRRRLLATYGAQDDGDLAYPALTIANGETRRKFDTQASQRGPVQVQRVNHHQDVVTLLTEKSGQGAACLWVRNAVDDAIAAVKDLRAAGINADLLHARFALCDRLRHEEAALARFGKHGEGRAGHVLVATQIVESSLDLDFDVMVSDLAPVASLIQRAGRLWRHMDLRPSSQRPVKAPVLYVLSPDPDDVTDQNWLRSVLDKGAWVYPVDLQWKTAKILFQTRVIDAPSGLRALIEAVHGAGGLELPAPLTEAEIEREGRGLAEANQARRGMIDLDGGYRKSGASVADIEYPTRLGRPQQRVMLARWNGDALDTYAGGGGVDGCQLSELQIALNRLQGLSLPDQAAPQIAALIRDWPEWQRKSVKVLPLADDGHICPGLSYFPGIGMVFEGEEERGISSV